MAEDFQSALTEREGIEQPDQVNPNLTRHKRRVLSLDDYVEGILKGDRVILSRAITLIESANPDHFEMAQAIIERCLPLKINSHSDVDYIKKSVFLQSKIFRQYKL